VLTTTPEQFEGNQHYWRSNFGEEDGGEVKSIEVNLSAENYFLSLNLFLAPFLFACEQNW